MTEGNVLAPWLGVSSGAGMVAVVHRLECVRKRLTAILPITEIKIQSMRETLWSTLEAFRACGRAKKKKNSGEMELMICWGARRDIEVQEPKK